MISDNPCPRCKCYVIKHFECACGLCNENYCANCGRFTTLMPHEHIELSPIDKVCEMGNVEHEHTSEEKTARVDAYFEGAQHM